MLYGNHDYGSLIQLKTQAKGELDLAFAVEGGAIGVGDGAEAGGAIGAA